MPVRDLAAVGVVLAAVAALVVSVQRRAAGVAGQRETVERRSERVAAMTGIDRAEQRFDRSVPEFPPALDLVAVLVFALVGRRSHAHGITLGGVLETAAPFLCGTAAGYLVAALTLDGAPRCRDGDDSPDRPGARSPPTSAGRGGRARQSAAVQRRS